MPEPPLPPDPPPPPPPPDVDVLWQAAAGSQQLFLSCPVSEILLHGTRGGGKTDALLFKFARYCGMGFGSWWRGILFRRTYKQLDEIITKTNRWFAPLFPNAHFVGGEQMKWKWDTGEELLLRHFDKPDDYWNYHGHEYPFVAWEELTAWPSLDCYEVMKACWRSSCPNPKLPRFYVATSNPYGPGHNAVKHYWIDQGPPGQIIRDTQSSTPRVHIHSSVYENKALMKAQPDYVKQLEAISDPGRRAAWLQGSWDITSGGMFDDLWDARVHVLPWTDIPHTWRVERAFDWGSSRPFSVGWWARSDGESPLKLNGVDRHFPKDTLVRAAEWYGWNGTANNGCRMLASEVARGILEREDKMGWRGRVRPGAADTAIYDIVNGKSIGDEMQLVGVRFQPADKGPGSRRNGWEACRVRMGNAIENEEPGLFVFDTCRQFIRTVPTAPRDDRDPDDIDTDCEDHICIAFDSKIITEYGVHRIGDLVGTAGRVLSMDGRMHAYYACRRTRRNAPVVRVTFADGRSIRCTPDHRFLTTDGWIEAAHLTGRQCQRVTTQKSLRQRISASWASITTSAANTFRARVAACTARYGNTIMDRLNTAITFIISTATEPITESTTYSAFRPADTPSCMHQNWSSVALNSCHWPETQPPTGTAAQRDDNGIRTNTPSIAPSRLRAANSESAINAASTTSAPSLADGFAPTNASQSGGGSPGWTTRLVPASNASRRLSSTVSCPTDSVAETVQVLRVEDAGTEDVYCLTVPDMGCFAMEGGVILRQCDEMRYQVALRYREAIQRDMYPGSEQVKVPKLSVVLGR